MRAGDGRALAGGSDGREPKARKVFCPAAGSRASRACPISRCRAAPASRSAGDERTARGSGEGLRSGRIGCTSSGIHLWCVSSSWISAGDCEPCAEWIPGRCIPSPSGLRDPGADAAVLVAGKDRRRPDRTVARQFDAVVLRGCSQGRDAACRTAQRHPLRTVQGTRRGRCRHAGRTRNPAPFGACFGLRAGRRRGAAALAPAIGPLGRAPREQGGPPGHKGRPRRRDPRSAGLLKYAWHEKRAPAGAPRETVRPPTGPAPAIRPAHKPAGSDRSRRQPHRQAAVQPCSVRTP